MSDRTIKFFMPMIPPTKTAQEKKIAVGKDGKARIYTPPELKEIQQKLIGHLAGHKPEEAFSGPVELVVTWCFKASNPSYDGQWKITKPDTDNLQKALKDCMTKIGFWKDDALVCREIVEKFWAMVPGIYVRVSELE